MLHVRRVPVRLNCAKTLHRQVCWYATTRIIEPRLSRGCCFLIRWVENNVLKERSDQDLLMIDPVSGTNGRLAMTEWIPCQAKSWREVLLGNIDYILPEWRCYWSAIECRRTSGVVLRVDDQSVTPVASTSDAVAGARNQRSLGWIVEFRHKR